MGSTWSLLLLLILLAQFPIRFKVSPAHYLSTPKPHEDAIIAQGIARAQTASPQPPEMIWQRFDTIRQRLAAGLNAPQ